MIILVLMHALPGLSMVPHFSAFLVGAHGSLKGLLFMVLCVVLLPTQELCCKRPRAAKEHNKLAAVSQILLYDTLDKCF